MWLKLLLLAIAVWIAYRYVQKLRRKLPDWLRASRQQERCPSCGQWMQPANAPLQCPKCGEKLGRSPDGRLIIRVN
ncbi:hypothetical protein DUZ99_06625 [Xylanibacillus composti]|uniref:hypothetical protein n=1 Tax=Xylanibacillus composti TaxID=1572762 RepID=UPI001BCC1801|nr:hypothetical protein [Xylanibacillus composti]MDT9724666.1 hypothetical protein [Xylanibacillus composti]